MVYLRFPNTIATEKLDVLVTNAIGQTIFSETAKNTTQLQIDLSKMSKGVYYLKASTNEGTKLFKLIFRVIQNHIIKSSYKIGAFFVLYLTTF